MTNRIPLERVTVDWLTLSSSEPHIAEWAFQYMLEYQCTESKWMQYSGFSWSPRYGGSLFCGQGRQGNRDWWIVKVTGIVADDLWPKLEKFIDNDIVKCTRIDLAVTVQESDDWNQFELAARLKKAQEKNSKLKLGKNIDFRESGDKFSGTKLATVAVGSRESAEYVRIYEKYSEEVGKLLRFECEYKQGKAPGVVKALQENMSSAARGMRYRLDKLGDDMLKLEFACLLSSRPAKFVPVRSTQDKREYWLLQSVLPAFKRFVFEQNSENVVFAYLEVIDAWLGNEERDGD